MTELTKIEVAKSGVPRCPHNSKSRPSHIIMMLPRREKSCSSLPLVVIGDPKEGPRERVWPRNVARVHENWSLLSATLAATVSI